jgi:transposase
MKMIATAEAQAKTIEEQARKIEALEAKLRKDSTNSSKPPSSDAPWSKKRRQRKPASGRKQGGQPGHQGKTRQMLDASAVDEIRDHRPAACPSCGSGDVEALASEPLRHQVTEIPPVSAEVVEHRLHRGRCRKCGDEFHAPLPAGVPRSAFGPRVHALVASLCGDYRLSDREAARLLEDAFGVEMSTGSVEAAKARAARALETPHGEAVAAVRSCAAVNADETPWRMRGRMIWLWTATTQGAAAYLVDESRGFDAFEKLLGNDFKGMVVSDRMGAYDRLPILRRQVCWAHLERDFKALAEGAPKERGFGARGVTLAKAVMRAWREFAEHKDRDRMAKDLLPSWEGLLDLLVEGADSAQRRVRALCGHLLDRAEALSSFVGHEGVEPTNNAAERSLRRAVLWRKGSFGSQSLAGCRFVERVLTVTATLRKQGRDVLDYIVDAMRAQVEGRPPPALLPARALPG